MTSRLASLLVQENLVSAKKMAEAFQRQVIYGGTLDSILLEMDIIDEPALIDALGRAAQLPTAGDLPSAESLAAAGAARWFPHSVCERYRAVPISLDGNVLRVLVTDPPDRKQLDELGFMLSLSVDPIVVPEHRFMQAVELVYHVPLPARFQSLAAKLRKRAPMVEPPRPAPAPASENLPSDPMLAQVAELATTMAPSEARKPVVEPERRAVVTDVPMSRTQAAPAREQSESITAKLTTRQASSPMVAVAAEPPIRVPEEPPPPKEVEVAPPKEVAPPISTEPAVESSNALGIEEALSMLDLAVDRDGIFESVCRGARSQLSFVALFTVQGELALGRSALAASWVAKEIVARISVPLDQPSALQTTAHSHAPFLGRMGDEPISEAVLQALGRKTPTPALLAPIVLRERTVALLYGDAGGKPVDGAILAGLSSLTAAAARAFQRLILKQKGAGYSKAAAGAAGKLAEAPTAKATGGEWKAAPRGLAGAFKDAPRSPIHDLPTQQIRQISDSLLLDMDALIASVLMADDRSNSSAEALVALGERGALAVVARMPGPLKLARHTLRGPTPPLSEHGPLLALVARFGKLALGPLLARLSDHTVDVRYYAALAVGELKVPEAVAALGQRLLDSDGGVRLAATQGLARHSDSPELTKLTESLRGELPGPDPLRQQYASEALGALRDAASVPRLVELVKHPDAAVVLAARHALTEITKQDFGTSRWRWRSWWDRHKNEPRLEWLLEGLGHPEPEVRESASEELRAMSAETFGYHFDLPKREREEARRKWVDWWRAQKKN